MAASLVLTYTFSARAEPPVPPGTHAGDARPAQGERLAEPLAADVVTALWSDLDSHDGLRAYRALRQLAAAPRQALPLIREHLSSARPPDPARAARLVAELDHERFAVRQRASEELEKLGPLAETALRKTLADRPSLELRRRAERLLDCLEEPSRYAGRLRESRIVPLLEEIGTPEARRLLAVLSGGANEDQQTIDATSALERLDKRMSGVPLAAMEPGPTLRINDIRPYLRDTRAPVRKGPLQFKVVRTAPAQASAARIEARYFRGYNGFRLGYVLRGQVDAAKLREKELSLRDLRAIEVFYTDDLLEARGARQVGVDALIQQLYRAENKVQLLGSVIPGGELLDFSLPMKTLILRGETARRRLEQCLADPRIQNEVALILGAIGDERTVLRLIDAYPEGSARGRDSEDRDRQMQVVCLTYALTYLTVQPIGRSREGTDFDPGNRQRWKAWRSRVHGSFRVPTEKARDTWVPDYPQVSSDWAERARREFTADREE
jgi:hypothetical protein